MAKKKIVRRSISKTLLLVGEGHAEKAFLSHLKSLFSNGTFKVSVVTAGGKGPEHVITHAISCKKCDGYDFVIVLLDTDLPWPKKHIQNALSTGINLIGSEPCLEGLHLDILGRKKLILITVVKNYYIHCYLDHVLKEIVTQNYLLWKY